MLKFFVYLGQPKPMLFEPCYRMQCPFDLKANFSPKSQINYEINPLESFDKKHRDFQQKSKNIVQFGTITTATDKLNNELFRWDYGEWESCSVPCLGGKIFYIFYY